MLPPPDQMDQFLPRCMPRCMKVYIYTPDQMDHLDHLDHLDHFLDVVRPRG